MVSRSGLIRASNSLVQNRALLRTFGVSVDAFDIEEIEWMIGTYETHQQ